jgi:lipopolysaccharide transport system permease protein
MEKTIIEPSKSVKLLAVKELLAYRELLVVMAWRDIKVRYVQTALGPLWALVKPLSTLAVFVLVFSVLAQVDTGDVPYPLFALAGLSSWTFFAAVIDQAGNSIVASQGMIRKIYFPRLILPISKVMVCLVDFGIILVFLAFMMLFYGFMPPVTIVFLPVFVIMIILAALALSVWVNALTIRYRDFLTVTPVLVQIGAYITPVAYPISRVPEKYHWLFYMNPMAGLVQGFRWCLLGTEPPGPMAFASFGIMMLLLVLGLYYFKKMERIMADLV